MIRIQTRTRKSPESPLCWAFGKARSWGQAELESADLIKPWGAFVSVWGEEGLREGIPRIEWREASAESAREGGPGRCIRSVQANHGCDSQPTLQIIMQTWG